MPIDPSIPLMALRGGGGGGGGGGMSSLAQMFQLLNTQQDNQRAQELLMAQQIEAAQRMQLAQQQEERAQTKFGQEQRQFGIQQLATRAVGSVPDVGTISDELWNELMATAGPETRVLATGLRNKFRSEVMASKKAEAEAAQALEKAREGRAEAVAALAGGTHRAFGTDPTVFQAFVQHVAEAYPDEVKQFLPMIQGGVRPEQIAGIYQALELAAPSRKPALGSPGQQFLDPFGPRGAPVPPAALGPFQLRGGPGDIAEQYDAQGQLKARLAVPQTADQRTAGSGGGKAGVDMTALPLKEQVWINNAVSQARGIDNKNSQIAAMKTAIEADTAAGDPNRPSFKRAMRLAAAENLPAATERVRVNQRSEMLNASRAMQDALTKLKARGVNTNILTGSVESVARALGTTTDPELVSLRNELMLQLQAYMNAVTGASYTDKEHARFVSMFPNWQNQNAVNQALLAGLINAHTRQDWEFWSNKFGDEGAEFLGAKRPGGGNQGGGQGGGGLSPVERYRQRQRG